MAQQRRFNHFNGTPADPNAAFIPSVAVPMTNGHGLAPHRVPIVHSSPDDGDLSTWHNPGAVEQLFDYASFMWDAGGDVLGHFSPEGAQVNFNSANGWIVRQGFLSNPFPSF